VRDKATTRRRLSEAALLLFATQGYDATTTRQIAEAAHVTERSFFKHFPGKADAIVDLAPEDLDLLSHLIVTSEAGLPDILVVERAVSQWHLRFDDMEAYRQRTRLMVQASHRSVVIRGRLSDYRDLSADTAAQALAQRHGKSVPGTETKLLASIVLKAHQDIIREWILGDDEFVATAERFYAVLNTEFGAAADWEAKIRPTRGKGRSRPVARSA
jgi:AcrR family transcriptional regulator